MINCLFASCMHAIATEAEWGGCVGESGARAPDTCIERNSVRAIDGIRCGEYASSLLSSSSPPLLWSHGLDPSLRVFFFWSKWANETINVIKIKWFSKYISIFISRFICAAILFFHFIHSFEIGLPHDIWTCVYPVPLLQSLYAHTPPHHVLTKMKHQHAKNKLVAKRENPLFAGTRNEMRFPEHANALFVHSPSEW